MLTTTILLVQTLLLQVVSHGGVPPAGPSTTTPGSTRPRPPGVNPLPLGLLRGHQGASVARSTSISTSGMAEAGAGGRPPVKPRLQAPVAVPRLDLTRLAVQKLEVRAGLGGWARVQGRDAGLRGRAGEAM